MVILGLCFVLIDWLSFGKRGSFVWNWTSEVNGVEIAWTQIDKRSGRNWKLDNFHGRHICIISYVLTRMDIDINVILLMSSIFWYAKIVFAGKINERFGKHMDCFKYKLASCRTLCNHFFKDLFKCSKYIV